jgi:HlyD family secretion protein
MNNLRILLLSCAPLLLAACSKETPRALGTVEWDRITLPATASERILAIEVREGQRVHAGEVLLRLDSSTLASQLEANAAEEARQEAALAELRTGPRAEQIARQRASLAAAEATAAEARAQYQRAQSLAAPQLIAQAELDRARATADAAEAQVRAARQALLELTRGTRAEQIAQGEAAARAAAAQVAALRLTLDKLTLTAPREGVVDSLPYRVGDQPPAGAPLVTLLVGEAPHARVYVPLRLRAAVTVGDAATVHVEGVQREFAGTVRMIRSEPVFTPYYALTGQDASRLSYLAEIQLGADAAQLPAGLPVSVTFAP